MATNGSTDNTPSKLAQITKDVDPDKADLKTVKKLLGEYSKLNDVISAAEASAQEARDKQYEIAEQVVKQTGSKPLMYNGMRLVPSCRKDNVFFKNMSEQEALNI